MPPPSQTQAPRRIIRTHQHLEPTTRTTAATFFFFLLLLLPTASSGQPTFPDDAAAVERHCGGMLLHGDVCAATLSAMPPGLSKKPLPEVISYVVSRAADAVRAAASNCTSYLAPERHSQLRVRDRLALADCLELFSHTLTQLATASSELELELSNSSRTAEERVAGVQTVLSAAMTNQFTCLDGFSDPTQTPGGPSPGPGPSDSSPGRVRPYIQGRILHVSHLLSNSLALLRRLPSSSRRRRRRVPNRAGGFPSWISAADRRRLEQQQVAAADATVAKDGSGDYATVGEAVAAAPNNSARRWVIRVKTGGYFENVEVGSEKTNLMLVGDGMWKTVIKASRNVVDNYTTFRSATLARSRDATLSQGTRASRHHPIPKWSWRARRIYGSSGRPVSSTTTRALSGLVWLLDIGTCTHIVRTLSRSLVEQKLKFGNMSETLYYFTLQRWPGRGSWRVI